PRTRVGIAFVTKKSFDAGRFVKKRQRAGDNGLNEIREARAVMTGLLGNHGKRCALFFCLDHAESVTIHPAATSCASICWRACCSGVMQIGGNRKAKAENEKQKTERGLSR